MVSEGFSATARTATEEALRPAAGEALFPARAAGARIERTAAMADIVEAWMARGEGSEQRLEVFKERERKARECEQRRGPRKSFLHKKNVQLCPPKPRRKPCSCAPCCAAPPPRG